MKNNVKNILCFDVEFWYDSEFIKKRYKRDMLKKGLRTVIEILDKTNAKATFFVTGKVIEKYPYEIKKICQKGHEIASHGYTHKMINKMSKKDFEKEIKDSVKIITKNLGKKPLGFRAPSWSVSKKEFWIYDILKKNGFKYSSSIFPVNLRLYGENKLPLFKFKIKDIVEFPITPFVLFGIRIPFSGGIYFRIWPLKIIEYFIKKMNKNGERVILYLHPWEFCMDLPKVKTSFLGKIATYYGIKKTKVKFEGLLKKFQFVSFKDTLL
ncbi:MAG: polysaccharide deacetylase family protein [Nanoarchaeota archaeon]